MRCDRHKINNYSEFLFLPPKRIHRSKLRIPDTRVSIESLRVSLSRNISIPPGRILVPPEQKINDRDSTKTQNHEEAHDHDDEDDYEDENDSTCPDGEDT
jgi:hypothetical protein